MAYITAMIKYTETELIFAVNSRNHISMDVITNIFKRLRHGTKLCRIGHHNATDCCLSCDNCSTCLPVIIGERREGLFICSGCMSKYRWCYNKECTSIMSAFGVSDVTYCQLEECRLTRENKRYQPRIISMRHWFMQEDQLQGDVWYDALPLHLQQPMNDTVYRYDQFSDQGAKYIWKHYCMKNSPVYYEPIAKLVYQAYKAYKAQFN
jgi:hypothetical protein